MAKKKIATRKTAVQKLDTEFLTAYQWDAVLQLAKTGVQVLDRLDRKAIAQLRAIKGLPPEASRQEVLECTEAMWGKLSPAKQDGRISREAREARHTRELFYRCWSIDDCRKAMAANDMDKAVLAGMRAMFFGQGEAPNLVATAAKRSKFEAIRNTGSEGGKERARKKNSLHQLWLGDYRKIRAQHPKWTKSRIYQRIAKEAESSVKPNTIGRAIRKLEQGRSADGKIGPSFRL
jgi:hypothetical protein